MAPSITKWTDFAHVSEEFDSETGEFEYTMFAIVDLDDAIYYCELPTRKAEVSFQQVTASLKPIPFCEAFPEWPLPNGANTKGLTQAPLLAAGNNAQLFIKRPCLPKYDVAIRYKQVHFLAQNLLEEAYAMEFLSKHPHPNIIRYHGCRCQGIYLTGIVLDRYSYTLKDYVKQASVVIDNKVFMSALKSAINHLHFLGWAHNDLNPTNVMINDSGIGGAMPIVIDFGSAREVGMLLGTSRGTPGWYDGRIEDYTISKKENDMFALKKMREWLDRPTFSDDED
ncbi:kinase-like domain-containing protein [Nemania diffusa]|nr:kinase-like domain-containing protein [Nemania diffusa]